MSTENPTSNAAANSGTWFDSATEAVRSGVSDAQKSAENVLPAINAAMSKGAFNLGYGIGYGVAFPTVLIARVIPQENCAVWGFVDGAAAAHEAVYRDQRDDSLATS